MKQKTPIPKVISNQIQDAINSKQEKPGGNQYELLEDHKFYGQNIVPAGSKLIECNDGYYKIIKKGVRGTELHYRIGAIYIKNLNLKTITDGDNSNSNK